MNLCTIFVYMGIHKQNLCFYEISFRKKSIRICEQIYVHIVYVWSKLHNKLIYQTQSVKETAWKVTLEI